MQYLDNYTSPSWHERTIEGSHICYYKKVSLKRLWSNDIITQLVTNHGAFRPYLNRFNVKPTPQTCQLYSMNSFMDGLPFVIFYEGHKVDTEVRCPRLNCISTFTKMLHSAWGHKNISILGLKARRLYDWSTPLYIAAERLCFLRASKLIFQSCSSYHLVYCIILTSVHILCDAQCNVNHSIHNQAP